MSASETIVILLVGLVAGALASWLTGGRKGAIRYIATGLIGAFVGGWLFRAAGISLGIDSEILRALVTATIGAVIVSLIARMVV